MNWIGKQECRPTKDALLNTSRLSPIWLAGGFLIYGLNNEGVPQGMDGLAIEKAVNQLANLGREALEPPIILEHAVINIEGVPLLCVHIPESPTKPVHLRGKPMDQAFIRSGATTRIASRPEIGNLMLHSRHSGLGGSPCFSVIGPGRN